MFVCPNCGADTHKLIGSVEHKKVMCPSCHVERGKITYNYRLHEVVAADNSGKHKVTRGKQAEIDGRYICKDNPSIVLSKDNGGREARY